MENLRGSLFPDTRHPSDRPALGWAEHRPRLVLDSAGVTHPGRRRSNEDQHLIVDLAAARSRAGAQQMETADEELLLVVADGMGGHPSGEVASLLAVRVLLKELIESPAPIEDPLGRLDLAVRSSDATLHRASVRKTELAAMGTTLTAAWWIPPMLFFTHVGDSRLCLVRDGRLHRLTRDHTLGAALGAAGGDEARAKPGGAPAPAAARTSGFGHVLTQAVGGGEPGVDPDLGVRRLEPGDALLLCTDGLLRGVTEEEIARALKRTDAAHTAAMALLEWGLATDDRDNITVVTARVQSAARRRHARPGGRDPREAV